eukprot:1158646-Pelagomonas_calceolata.AAC.4
MARGDIVLILVIKVDEAMLGATQQQINQGFSICRSYRRSLPTSQQSLRFKRLNTHLPVGWEWGMGELMSLNHPSPLPLPSSLFPQVCSSDIAETIEKGMGSLGGLAGPGWAITSGGA